MDVYTTWRNGEKFIISEIRAYIAEYRSTGGLEEKHFICSSKEISKFGIVAFFKSLLSYIKKNKTKFDSGWYIQFACLGDSSEVIPMKWFWFSSGVIAIKHDTAFRQVLLTKFINDEEVKYVGNGILIDGMKQRSSKNKILNYRRLINLIKNLPEDNLEADEDRYYKNKKKESLARFKAKYPAGLVIDDFKCIDVK